jgi:hypothetical protein
MDKITAGETVKASWINPVNGEKEEIGRFEGVDIQEFSIPENWLDAILLMESFA